MTGVPFLVEQLGPDARIAVEVAWGADLSAASSAWAWSDITTDVRMADGVHLRHGRNDEATVAAPASCAMTLDNSTGAYSLGGQSTHWPFVRQGTPVRVMVDHDGNGAFSVLFLGYADSWQPAWNKAATVADVALSASGVLRRLQQQTSPVLSSLRRRLTSESNVVAYWPLEDGNRATNGLSAIQGHPPMSPLGDVKFASNTSFASTVQMPVFGTGGSLSGDVPAYANTGSWQVRVLAVVPDDGSGMADAQPMFRIYTASPQVARIDFLYGTLNDGTFAINVYDSSGTLVSGGAVYVNEGLNGDLARLYLSARQNGANVDFILGRQHLSAGDAVQLTRTITGVSLGSVTRVELNPGGVHNGIALGQAVVQNAITNVFTDYGELTAFDAESALTRFRRLCDENGIERSEFGDGISENTVTDKMGTQRPDTLLALLRDTESVDRGLIYDGLGNAGLTRWGRRAIENRTATLTIDAAAAQLGGVLTPVDDDQARVNKAVVNREDGSTAVVEDVTGPLGTATVGVYDTALAVPCNSDDAPAYYAGWLVNLGTVEGYRYPSIELDLGAAPALVPAWLTIGPGRRLDVVNTSAVATQHPDGDVRLLVQGYEQTLTPYSWAVRVNCSPYEPWRVGRLSADSGDSSTTLLRLDADASTLAAPVSAGATSLSVATASSTRWTTNPDDLPLEIDVGGIAITVTGISGTGSTQTFTVTGSTVTKALTTGLAVTVHDPKVLGL